MSRQSFKSILFLMVLSAIGIFSFCRDTNNPDKEEFVPGEILVGLVPSLDYDQAKILLAVENTKIIDLLYNLTIYLLEGDPDTTGRSLEQSAFIMFYIPQPSRVINDKTVIPILLMTEGVASKDYFKEIFSTYSQLDTTIIYKAKLAKIEVPVGREKEYVEIFAILSSEIKYADLNYIYNYID